jgi:hypothetical protein
VLGFGELSFSYNAGDVVLLPISSGESGEEPDAEYASKFGLLVGKLNACLNHLEQFPIKVPNQHLYVHNNRFMRFSSGICVLGV